MYISSCLFSLIWSGLLVTSRCILSLSLVLSCLDVLIKYYYLSLRPRLRVLVPPCCVRCDTLLDARLLKVLSTYITPLSFTLSVPLSYLLLCFVCLWAFGLFLLGQWQRIRIRTLWAPQDFLTLYNKALSLSLLCFSHSDLKRWLISPAN